jgi:methyl-accepting chemotaxis protein
MAKQNVPQGSAGVSAHDGAADSLELVDAMVQRSADSISALAKAAKKMLSLDADALMTVADLLDQIDTVADSLSDSVNNVAESHDSNHVDEHRRTLSKRLWDQHNALHGNRKVEADHV